MHPNIHSSTLNNSQDMEATYVCINRWMDKEDVVYMHNGILHSHKKEWNNAICSSVEWPRDTISNEISQTEKDKYHMMSLICGIFKKWYKWTYLQNRNRLTDIENKPMVTKGDSGGCGGRH